MPYDDAERVSEEGRTDDDAAGFWEARYGEREQIWSGHPNEALVATVTDIPPGRALDLGCGEGSDSVWLAERGWQVTAIDISTTAIARGQSRAAARHIPDGSITWIAMDLNNWHPDGTYQLVSACFLHSPRTLGRTRVLRESASAVTAGGHLLIVGHAEAPPWAKDHDHAHHHFLGPAEERAALQLDDDGWETVINDVRSRAATGPNGEHATLRDSVLLIRRR